MGRLSRGLVLGVVLAVLLVCLAVQRASTRDTARTDDGRSWDLVNAEARSAAQNGKQVVVLRPKGEPGPGSLVGMALVEGQRFTEGTIDIDLKGKGQEQKSFLGVAFAVADGTTFEAVYFRPFNFRANDADHRGHAVQYVAWPVHTWEQLRRDKPGVYEAAIKPVPDPGGWFHARVEVTKKQVRVFVDGAVEPCLVVDRLAGRTGDRVGLWVDSIDGAFADFKVVPAKAS
jgi:hypothetical protein